VHTDSAAVHTDLAPVSLITLFGSRTIDSPKEEGVYVPQQ
jgi:hypothetical protein